MAVRGHQLKRHRGRVQYAERRPAVSLGVVVPFDFELDWEYWRYLPEGVAPYFTRTPYVRGSVGVQLARSVGRPGTVRRAARELLPVSPAAVLFACSSASFVGGVKGERELREAMASAGAPNPITTSSAMVDAFRATGVATVAVASPYTVALTRSLVGFLDESGTAVSSCAYLGLAHGMANVHKETIAELVRGLDDEEADAVFVGCTSLSTYGLVVALEGELGRPVFTANQVSLWRALVAAGQLPRPAGAPDRAWMMGGPPPTARSTKMLMAAAGDPSWRSEEGP